MQSSKATVTATLTHLPLTTTLLLALLDPLDGFLEFLGVG